MTVLAFSLVTATVARAATSRAAIPRAVAPARGLDVSAYQHLGGAINWPLLARAGLRFVAIKSTEGTYYTNPYYSSDARAAAAAGLAVLPYVFANPRRATGDATARFAVAAARYAPGRARLPLEVDLENDPYTAPRHPANCYGLGVGQMIAWIAAFTARTAALTGTPPIIYTTAAWWQQCTAGTALFRRDPLWLAAYDTAAPGVPPVWKQWTFWQYDEDAVLPGVGLVDLDFYRATAALPALRPLPAPRHASRASHRPRTPRK